MPTITLHEAQANLSEWIRRLAPGEEILIVEGDRAVARLIAADRPRTPPLPPGFLRGSVLFMAPDFDAPLEDFGAHC